MPAWRGRLDRSAALHSLGDNQAIDTSGFDRIAASRKYADQSNYTFKSMKTTVLVGCESFTILDVHSSTKRPHDMTIARQLLSRNFDRVGVLIADIGYGSSPLRRFHQVHDVEPAIKFREHGPVDYARNRL